MIMTKKVLIISYLLCTILYAQTYSVKIDTTFKSSFRACYAVSDKVVWVAGSLGTVGKTTDGGSTWTFQRILDTTRSELRDIYAWDENSAIVLSVKDPAEILKTTDAGKTWKSVYKDATHHVFLDGFSFWDKSRGIVFGDPIKDHFVILTTTDEGNTWIEHVHNNPHASKNESAFAASGTSICVGAKGKVLFGTGGHASHVFVSEDYGKTWHHHETPITHGMNSKGINSICFADDKNGVVIGGDFTLSDDSERNYAVTSDGGISWHYNNKNKHPHGYKSCVEFIGNKTYISVGKTGIDISTDLGQNWEQISKEGFHTVHKSKTGKTIFLLGVNKIGRLIIKK